MIVNVIIAKFNRIRKKKFKTLTHQTKKITNSENKTHKIKNSMKKNTNSFPIESKTQNVVTQKKKK